MAKKISVNGIPYSQCSCGKWKAVGIFCGGVSGITVTDVVSGKEIFRKDPIPTCPSSVISENHAKAYPIWEGIGGKKVFRSRT